ncbi:hypothetical protein Xenpb_03200 [Xenorhabdus sp. PB62.4]|nr:hypothetical protein [Xenorhabdus sp. PB62.4]
MKYLNYFNFKFFTLHITLIKNNIISYLSRNNGYAFNLLSSIKHDIQDQ